MLGGIGEGEGDGRGWNGWMASQARCTWVWVNSGSWWWTGRPGLLQSLGLQRVGHDWATELKWPSTHTCIKSYHLQTVIVSFMIFQFGLFLFLFLLWLPWLDLPKLCWIKMVRMDIIVLFLILKEIPLNFHHWEWCLLWVCCIWA